MTIQGSCFGSDEIKALILRFLQQWVLTFYVEKSSYSSRFISVVRVNVTQLVTSDPQERITGTTPRELTCDCITGTTVYTTRGTDNHFWMLTMMEHHCPSQHLTPPRTPPGMNTHFSVNVKTVINTWNRTFIRFLFISTHRLVLLLLPLLHQAPPYLSLGWIHMFFYLSLSSGFRSSLGEYHKDSRNLRRHKDSSELTIKLLACYNIWIVETEYLWEFSWCFLLWIFPP